MRGTGWRGTAGCKERGATVPLQRPLVVKAGMDRLHQWHQKAQGKLPLACLPPWLCDWAATTDQKRAPLFLLTGPCDILKAQHFPPPPFEISNSQTDCTTNVPPGLHLSPKEFWDTLCRVCRWFFF